MSIGPAGSVAFFLAAFYLYVWLWLDPSLLYYGAGLSDGLFPVFSSNPSFLIRFFSYPGGGIECVSAFLSQLYACPWLGALVLTVVTGMVSWGTSGLVKALVGVRVPIVWLIPSAFVIALTSHHLQELDALCKFLFALLAVRVSLRAAGCRGQTRLALFVGLCGVTYYLSCGTYLLYVLLGAALELRGNRGRPIACCGLVAAALVPWLVGEHLLGLVQQDAYARILPWRLASEPVGQYPLLGFFLFLLVIVGSAALCRPREADATRLWRVIARPGVELALSLIAVALVAAVCFDSNGQALLRLNCYARKEMWPEVLSGARHVRRSGRAHGVPHVVIRALYETGRLPYDMFSYPQNRMDFMPAWGMRNSWVARTVEGLKPLVVHRTQMHERAGGDLYRSRLSQFFQLGDLDLQLGLVNEAEHGAHEALEALREYPEILQRLALVNIVKGRTEAARVFLNALTGHLYHRQWARDALCRLETDPLWSHDPLIQQIRSRMFTRESAILITLSFEDRLSELLRVNPHNRMAFEYLMASHLLNGQLEKLVSELHRLDDFEYPRVPRHYEEAVLIHEAIMGQSPDLGGRRISAATRLAFQAFQDDFVSFSGQPAAQRALERRFGDTYFFYYFFGESPGVSR